MNTFKPALEREDDLYYYMIALAREMAINTARLMPIAEGMTSDEHDRYAVECWVEVSKAKKNIPESEREAI